MASLNGKVIAYLEARMRSEMGSLIERHGGVPYAAPVLQEKYLTGSPEIRQLVEDVCQDRLDVVVLLTGVGTRALVEAADSMGLKDRFLASLNQRTIIARSPKPARVLRQHNIHIDLMPPEPYTSQDLISALGPNALNPSAQRPIDLNGKAIAVQAYGAANGYLTRSLRELGAEVREVTLYTWDLPADTSPVLTLIQDLAKGKIHALAFTSQPQVGNLIAIASGADQEESLRSSLAGRAVAVASVGPVCSRRLTEAGFRIDVEPEHPHMGNLVMAIGDHFQATESPAR